MKEKTFYKEARKRAEQYKDAPVVRGGDITSLLHRVTEGVLRTGDPDKYQAVLSFYEGGDPFYKRLVMESAAFFGKEGFHHEGDIGIYLTLVGKPHIDQSEFMDVSEYAGKHDECFGTDISSHLSEPDLIPPHHILWLIGRQEVVTWGDLAGYKREQRGGILRSCVDMLRKDRSFLRDVSGKDVLTTVAFGFDEEKQEVASQTDPAIHIHNTIVPEKAMLEKVSASTDIRALDINSPYIRLVKEEFPDDVHTLIRQIFQDAGVSFSESEIVESEDPFDQLSFRFRSDRGMDATDVFEGLIQLYKQLETVWEYALRSSDPGHSEDVSPEELLPSEFLDKLKALRGKDTRRFPSVPSFNVVMTWNEDGETLREVSIAPSSRGPAERVRHGVLKRDASV